MNFCSEESVTHFSDDLLTGKVPSSRKREGEREGERDNDRNVDQ